MEILELTKKISYILVTQNLNNISGPDPFLDRVIKYLSNKSHYPPTFRRSEKMKRSVFLIILLLLVISFFPFVKGDPIDEDQVFFRSSPTTTQTRILVGPSETYTTIQSAVDDANEGDIIEVLDGSYYAPITIDKPLTVITRNGWSRVTVRAINERDHGFIVTSDRVEIRGFTIIGWDINWSSRAAMEEASGVILKGVDNCTIEYNQIVDFRIGVMLYYAGTEDRPINSDNNTIRYNYIEGSCEVGGYTGVAIEGYTGTMYGTPAKWAPMNNLITRNRIFDTYIGVVSNGGQYNDIRENTFEENDIGVHLDGCHFNTISENEMFGSTKWGVTMDANSNNTFTYNLMKDGKGGFETDHSDDNIIYLNSFVNNTGSNANSDSEGYGSSSFIGDWRTFYGNDQWSSPTNINYTYEGSTYFGKVGNHYDDWTSPDNDEDGIVDNPYNIPGESNAKDHYPLVSYEHDWNTAPGIINRDLPNAEGNVPFSVKISAFDPDNITSELQWTMRTDATWLSFSSSQVLSGTPSGSDAGSNWVEIEVSDGILSDKRNFTINVIITNSPPRITSNDQTVVSVNNTYRVDYNATDPDGDQLSWSLNTNASWLSMKSTSGVISGIPTINDIGTYYIRIAVSDGALSDSRNFTLRVVLFNSPPLSNMSDFGLFNVEEDSSGVVLDLRLVFRDPDSDLLYDWRSTYNISVNSFEKGYLIFVPKEDWSGMEKVPVSAFDGEYRINVEIPVFVPNINDPPERPSITLPSNELEADTSLRMEANCIDPDLEYGDSLNYSWSVTDLGTVGWGSMIDFSLPEGTYELTLKVTDLDGATSEVTIELKVVRSSSPVSNGDREMDGRLLILLVLVLIMVLIAAVIFVLVLVRKRSRPLLASDLSGKLLLEIEDEVYDKPRTSMNSASFGEIRRGLKTRHSRGDLSRKTYINASMLLDEM